MTLTVNAASGLLANATDIDGGTTVIGGIYKVSTDQGQDRVPGLANIPVLGHLFKNRRREDSNEELLIFITPRVIKL